MVSILSITPQRYAFSAKYLVDNSKKVVKNYFKTSCQLILPSHLFHFTPLFISYQHSPTLFSTAFDKPSTYLSTSSNAHRKKNFVWNRLQTTAAVVCCILYAVVCSLFRKKIFLWPPHLEPSRVSPKTLEAFCWNLLSFFCKSSRLSDPSKEWSHIGRQTKQIPVFTDIFWMKQVSVKNTSWIFLHKWVYWNMLCRLWWFHFYRTNLCFSGNNEIYFVISLSRFRRPTMIKQFIVGCY